MRDTVILAGLLVGCGSDPLVGTWQGAADCEEVAGTTTEEAFELVLDEVAAAPDGERRFGSLVRSIDDDDGVTTVTFDVEAPVDADPGDTLVLTITCRTLDANPPVDPAIEALLCDQESDDLKIDWLTSGDMELDVFDDGSCVVAMERR